MRNKRSFQIVWSNALWADETKVVQFNHGKNKKYIRRPPNQEFSEEYTIKTIKHGSLRLMLENECCLLRPPNQHFSEEYTIKTIKHGGLRLML